MRAKLIRIFLWLVARAVTASHRSRWLEEWRAEVAHGGVRMLPGTIADARAVRRVARTRRVPFKPFQAFGQDLRHTARALVADPAFVLGVVVSLAIGMGASVVAFSFINAAVFRPYEGVRDQHELVRVRLASGDPSRGYVTFGTYQHYLRLSVLQSLQSLSASRLTKYAVFVDGRADSVDGALVSANYFAVLGVTPAAGRFFEPAEDRGPFLHPVAIISRAYWRSRFNERPDVMGASIVVNGATVVIVGVAPEHFTGVRKGDEQPAVWLPLGMSPLALRDRAGRPVSVHQAPESSFFEFVGRRRAGISVDQVREEMRVVAAAVSAEGGRDVTGEALEVWRNHPRESIPSAIAFMMIPLLVLGIACVNAGNLMLARASRQAHDWTVRLALGATRWRVFRHVLTEALLLATIATGCAVALSRWALQLLAAYITVPLPIDGHVITFTVAIAFVTSLAFGTGPAVRLIALRRQRPAPAAGTSSPARSRIRFALVALQAALSLGLLTTGLQFMRTVFADNPNAVRLPSPDTLLFAEFDLDPLRLEQPAADAFFARLIERARQVPGVVEAGTSTTGLVIGGLQGGDSFRAWLPGSPAEGTRGFVPMLASAGALQAIGVPLIQGRHFVAEDEQRLRAVIVNKAFADTHLQGNAIGRTFRLTTGHEVPELGREVTVVGVVDEVMKRGEAALIYYPVPPAYQPRRTLNLRVTGGFEAAALDAAVRDVDPRVPVTRLDTLRDRRAQSHSELKLLARAAGVLGGCALVLAAGGLYSVVAYVVSLRRREIGIRLALGAEPGDVVSMVVRQGLLPTILGSVVGAGGAAAAGAIVRSRMYGASAVDPLAYVAGAALMLALMVLASWIPARHAARVDPTTVLRTD